MFWITISHVNKRQDRVFTLCLVSWLFFKDFFLSNIHYLWPKMLAQQAKLNVKHYVVQFALNAI